LLSGQRLIQKIKETKWSVLAFAGLVVIIACFIWWPKQVTIKVEDEIHSIKTREIGTAAILRQAGIDVEPEDLIAESGFFWWGRTISVTKAIPVTIVDGEKKHFIRIPCLKEEEALKTAGITMGPEDYVETIRTSGPEGPGLIMQVNRITRGLVVERRELNFTTEFKPVYYLAAGRRRTVQAGHPGIKEVVWQVTYRNQQEVAREKLDAAVFKLPQNRVVVYGSIADSVSSPSMAYRGQPPAEFRRELILEATGYTHTGNPTFTGIYPRRGIVAVDPRVIPLGTLMWVEGYGYARAADTGGLIKGNIIDVFFDTEEEALEWGRRKVRVLLVEPW